MQYGQAVSVVTTSADFTSDGPWWKLSMYGLVSLWPKTIFETAFGYDKIDWMARVSYMATKFLRLLDVIYNYKQQQLGSVQNQNRDLKTANQTAAL